MQNRVASWIVLTGLAVALASSARAQDVPPDEVIDEEPPTPASEADDAADGSGAAGKVRRAAPRPVQAGGGNGIAISEDGRSRLHLGVDAGAGFDTNPYSVPLASNEFAADAVARIRPQASVNVDGSVLSFTSRAALDYGFLPGVVDRETTNFLLYQSSLGANLEYGRTQFLSFAVGDTVSWNNDPGNVVPGTTFNRLNNQLRVGAGLMPGGGALKFRLIYTFDFTKWFDFGGSQSSALIAGGALDNMTHTVRLRADYRFLPKTGVFTEVQQGWNAYVFDDTNPMSFPLGIRVGIQGQILTKLFGLVSLGYDNPLVLDTDDNGNLGIVTGTLIGAAGQAEIQWLPSPTTKLAAGFQRRFSPAPLYQYVGNNRFYGQYEQLLAGRFQVSAFAGYSILEFGEEQLALTSQPTGRLDGHLDVGARIAFFFTDWFALGAANNFDWRLTNAADPADPNLNFSYIRNETLVFASLRY